MKISAFLTRCIVALVAMSVGTQALAARTVTYLHNDSLGSVVAATNESGAVLWRKSYAPFGQQLESTPATVRTAYTGKEHDDAIGITNFGARQYDPEIGRFLNVDPVGFVDDNTMSFNRYLYVNNNPYKYVDPDGEFLNFAAKFVLDVALGVAINYATTGSLGIGMALKDSAMGILNPAKTLAKAGKLASLMAKAAKVEKATPKVAEKGGLNLFKFGKTQTTKADGWKDGDYMMHLPNKGSAKANWKQNSGRLRAEMKKGEPIYDSYRDAAGKQIDTKGFLNAERKLMEGRGWKYDSASGAYHAPK